MARVKKILNARKNTHGDYTDVSACVQKTKDQWRTHPGWQKLNAVQRETLDMIAHKVGRVLCGNPNVKDHWDDIAGYSVLVSDRIGR